MAELSNWLGDLWEEAGTTIALPDDLAGALTEALTSAPARHKAPSAMAELSATARRPEPAVDAAEADVEAPVAPVPPADAEPALPAVLMGSGRTRVEDDILPTRRPPGGRLIALRMSLRTR